MANSCNGVTAFAKCRYSKPLKTKGCNGVTVLRHSPYVHAHTRTHTCMRPPAHVHAKNAMYAVTPLQGLINKVYVCNGINAMPLQPLRAYL